MMVVLWVCIACSYLMFRHLGGTAEHLITTRCKNSKDNHNVKTLYLLTNSMHEYYLHGIEQIGDCLAIDCVISFLAICKEI